MCGIAALVAPNNGALESSITAMVGTLGHRGPDDSGLVVLPEDGVALGMRRLSILDIAGGRQPMWDESGQHGVVFNGEIYNFRELRQELAGRGHVFRTDHSDTEVLVHGFEEWGPDLFPKLNGMFAVALWDRTQRRLVVARDRTGEKPLYIARVGRGFAVASELKAILALREFDRTLDFVALEQYLSFDYVVGPRTIFRDVKKLPAGHYAVITQDDYTVSPYWTLRLVDEEVDERRILRELDELLDASVRARMVADVPVGLFLSGGVDSTTIGYYMRRHSDEVHSFSIGFEDRRFDESDYAQLAARHLGTTHRLEIFSEERVLGLLPRVAEIFDEPVGDQSVLPTYLLSLFAREHVKVALGGDGSDELFMGYKAYQALKLSWALDKLPWMVRRAVAGLARRVPDTLGRMGLRGKRFLELVDRPPVARFLSHLGGFKGSARGVLAREIREVLPESVFEEAVGRLCAGLPAETGPANQTIAAYLRGYLQEDILVKVDRASMAASLEVRSPFLDPALVEFLGRVPARLKLKGMTRKYLLRALMRGRIPDAILDRRKRGFGVPISAWLRGRLAATVREYLAPGRLAAARIFDPAAVDALVRQHLSGRVDRGNELWILLQFEMWRERWLR